jgi:chaperone modulatory protein CbpM
MIRAKLGICLHEEAKEMTKKTDILIIADYSHADKPLSLHEFLEITHIPEEMLVQFIQYDIIHQPTLEREQWQFDTSHLARVQRALRLQHDLEVNLAGIAVLLDLLDEMDRMRERLALLEKLYNR